MRIDPFLFNYDWYSRIMEEICREEKRIIKIHESFFLNKDNLDVLNNIKSYCEIDEENMNPIFYELSLEFDKEKREKEITYETLILNSNFLPIMHNNEIVAYFQYTIFENIMFINELQIKSKYRNKVINFKMITNILKATKNEKPKSIYTLRQFNNKRAEVIYCKLGFKIISQLNDYDLLLKTDYDVFIKSLEKTIKIKA